MPDYYSSLSPFRKIFRKGLPILTYHKLGPRPRRARIKGLYLGARLFSRQLAQLRHAGFRAPGFSESIGASHPKGEVVLTFDDGFVSALKFGLDPLATHQFRAIQFLVADLIGKSNLWEQEQGEVEEPLMNRE